MTEGQPQPLPDPVTPAQETGSPEGIANLITSLVEQQTYDEDEQEARYNSPEVRAYNLLTDLRMAASPMWHDTVANVFTGYGALVYDRLPLTKQAIFLQDARRHQEARGADLQLTEEEGEILKNITHAVGVEYDPGTAENPEKRTFRLAEIERKASNRSNVSPELRRLLDDFRIS